ncbi:MAG: YhcH/YjgK/YiaL family protein [Nitrospirae bacterium]|nr:YhcH/YjgK/YiaL family protein [Nitrospirota bacterium]
MVVTDIEHFEEQVSMTAMLKKAFDFVQTTKFDKLPDGNIEIDSNKVFAIVQRYETVATDTPRFECHQKYIDLQYIASGEEIIGWAPANIMQATGSYDAEKDICFGIVPKEKITDVYLQAGQVAVLYPNDAHAPRLSSKTKSHVLKIVIKVAI